MKTKQVLAIILCVVMVLALAACGSAASTEKTEAPTESKTESKTADVTQVGSGDKMAEVKSEVNLEEEAKKAIIDSHTDANGKTFVTFATATNCSSWEPYKSIKNTNIYGKPVYEGLYAREGVGGNYVGVIAESTTKLDDYTWQVKIKDYVYDTNGNNITSQDVYFSYWTVAKETYNNGYFRQLDEVEIVDDYTVNFHMSTKSQALFEKMTYNYIWSQKSFEATGDNMATTPVGTGPYKAVDWVSGNHVTFEKRDDYWEKDASKINKCSQANVDIMYYNVIKDEAQHAIALQTNIADISEAMTDKNVSYFKDDANYQVFKDVDNKTLLCAFNCNEISPCGDVNLRKAIMYALDRDAMILGLYNGEGTVAKAPSCFTLADINPKWLENDYYSFNLDKAKECLKASAYNGEELVIMVEDEEVLNKGAQILQNCLEEIGVKSRVLSCEGAIYNTYRYDPEQFDIQFMTSGGSDYALNSWIQNCDTSAVDKSNMTVEDPVFYEILVKASEGCPDDTEAIDACYNYMTDNCMYIGISNGTKYIVTNDIVTACVTDYAQYVSPACCSYVWNS